MKHKIQIAIISFLLLLSLLSSMKVITNQNPYLYWNGSGSEPIGLYRIVPLDTLKDGDMVVMRVPESMHEYVYGRGWLKKEQNILKTVYAVPTESYLITDKEIVVKGTYVGPVYTQDREGLPLPILRGLFEVKAGYFLPLASRMPNSFDGRYFGEVSTELIIAKVVPLLLIPEGLF